MPQVVLKKAMVEYADDDASQYTSKSKMHSLRGKSSGLKHRLMEIRESKVISAAYKFHFASMHSGKGSSQARGANPEPTAVLELQADWNSSLA